MILLSTCGKLASTSAVLHSWISWKAFGITSGQPYMVNMAFDPMMAGCLIYLIQAGVHSWPHGIGLGAFVIWGDQESKPTTMGSDKDNTIVLKGAWLFPDMLMAVLLCYAVWRCQ